jgi:hypothetical protein
LSKYLNMKKFSFILFAVASMALATFSSCGKYEDGPGFSLSSKKARVANTWVIEKCIVNGQDVTTTFLVLLGDHSLVFKKDGAYEFLVDGDRETGTWSFDSKKENLELMENGSTTKFLQKITRLTSNEMWLVEDDGTDKTEYHYKSK